MRWHTLLHQVTSFVREHALFAPDDRVLLAVSGGVDSVVLLEALVALQPTLSLGALAVVYVDHGLRPEETPAEARFVRDKASSHGLPFFQRSLTLDPRAASLQAVARDARHRALEALCRDEDMRWIATGHHADDQAETLLMRLLRGTGPGGLAGIAPQRGRWARPLLSVSRAAIEAAAREQGWDWREDPSNASLRFTRNHVRHTLLPRLEQEYNPNLRAHLARLADEVRQDEALLNELVAARWKPPLVDVTSEGWSLDLDRWSALPPALQRRVLQRLVRAASGGRDVERHHLDTLAHNARHRHGEQHIPLPSFLQATRRYGQLLLRPTDPQPLAGVPPKDAKESAPTVSVPALSDDTATFCVEIARAGTYRCPHGVLEVREVQGREAWEEAFLSPTSAWYAFLLDLDSLSEDNIWRLRQRRAGDRLDFGSHHRPLKKWMIDAKIPRSLRYQIPLLEQQGMIRWVIGHLWLPPLQKEPATTGWRLRFVPHPTSSSMDPPATEL